MSVLFIAQVYNIHLGWMQLATILGVLLLTSKGAAAVVGSGFVTLVATLCALPGHPIPVEGVALLLGIDRFMSEARSVTNLIGNSVATVVIAKMEKEYEPKGIIE
jgi:aerobic C4-dicarboxylate transport protein